MFGFVESVLAKELEKFNIGDMSCFGESIHASGDSDVYISVGEFLVEVVSLANVVGNVFPPDFHVPLFTLFQLRVEVEVLQV